MTRPSLSRTLVRDAAGTALKLVAEDAAEVRLRCPDGTLLSVPQTLLSRQNDGSLRLPFSVLADRKGMTLRLPVLGDTLQVGKRQVNTEGVRINKTVQSHNEDIELTLASERIEIERVAIEREVPWDGPPTMREEGDAVVIPVLEERLVLRKQLVLKEELRIRRIRSEQLVTHSETLRREKITIVPRKE